MSAKMHLRDPACWMVFDGFETTPVVHSETCYICCDPDFARMGLPLCRKCPACDGHVQADDTVCCVCGLEDQAFWELLEVDGDSSKLKDCFSTTSYEYKDPSARELKIAILAFEARRCN